MGGGGRGGGRGGGEECDGRVWHNQYVLQDSGIHLYNVVHDGRVFVYSHAHHTVTSHCHIYHTLTHSSTRHTLHAHP